MAYVIMQIVGCIAGAFAVRGAIPGAADGFSQGGISQLTYGEGAFSAFGLSIVLTSVLFFTILSVRRTEGRMTSLIFCFTYFVVRMISYALYNGYFNPARTLAHAIAAGDTAWSYMWIDSVGSIAGAALSAFLFTAWNSGLAKP
jgi:glycerol uptake facilitator-like aquaporin